MIELMFFVTLGQHWSIGTSQSQCIHCRNTGLQIMFQHIGISNK